MSVRVYWLDCRKVNPDEARVRALMSERRKEKLAVIRDENGRRQSAAAELALALAMAREKGIRPQMVNWTTLPGGKPVAEGGLHFSLAHSGNVAVCAVCEQNVGVDVEAPRTIAAGMRRKICSAEEQSLPDTDLLRLWVAKESYLKLTGEGILRAMSGFSAMEGAIIDAEGNRLAHWHAAEEPMPGYILCACMVDAEKVEMIELQW